MTQLNETAPLSRRLELKAQREVFLKAEAVAATKAVKQGDVFAIAGLPGDDVELDGSDRAHRMADGGNLTLTRALAYLKRLPLVSEGRLRKLPGRDAPDGPVTYFLRKCEAIHPARGLDDDLYPCLVTTCQKNLLQIL